MVTKPKGTLSISSLGPTAVAGRTRRSTFVPNVAAVAHRKPQVHGIPIECLNPGDRHVPPERGDPENRPLLDPGELPRIVGQIDSRTINLSLDLAVP